MRIKIVGEAVDSFEFSEQKAWRSKTRMKNFPLFVGLIAVFSMMIVQGASKTTDADKRSGLMKSRGQHTTQGVCQPSPTEPPDDGGNG